jgi:hypothetical protein
MRSPFPQSTAHWGGRIEHTNAAQMLRIREIVVQQGARQPREFTRDDYKGAGTSRESEMSILYCQRFYPPRGNQSLHRRGTWRYHSATNQSGYRSVPPWTIGGLLVTELHR